MFRTEKNQKNKKTTNKVSCCNLQDSLQQCHQTESLFAS